MPLYEYKCNACGEKFEYLIQKKEEIPFCVKCGSRNLEKLPTTYKIKMWTTNRRK